MPVRPKTYGGKTVAQWAALHGVHEDTIRKRLRKGYREGRVDLPAYEAQKIDGKTLRELAEEAGISHQLMRARLHRLGWPLKKALSKRPDPCRVRRHRASPVNPDDFLVKLPWEDQSS